MNPELLIVGGGPAGMMAGLLFARAGVKTLVLEQHADFLRDFRGDTVHPSTMEILAQLGLLTRFLERPHTRIDQAEITVAGRTLKIGDLRHLDTPAPFIAMMPQWEFLDFLMQEARLLPNFELRMQVSAETLIERSGRITGVRLSDGEAIEASQLVIMADGRRSIIRKQGALPLTVLGAPMDIFWFAVPKTPALRGGLRGIVNSGRVIVMIDRSDYWQCAYLIPKGSSDHIRSLGIAAFRAEIEALVPDTGPLDDVLPDFSRVFLLSVALDRLDRWSRPGLLVIGDAAHAMSPIGGIGINLAIQDAVAAANILAGPLVRGEDLTPLLDRVRRRRAWPTRVIQAGQRLAQDTLINAALDPTARLVRPPLVLRMLDRFPLLRRIPGRIIGLGIRRERVVSPIA